MPESYEAYRKQQHRWHSGPMQLFRLCLPAVITSKVPKIFTFHILQLLIFITCAIISRNIFIADISMEESKLDTTILSIEETHPSFLFFHLVLHNSSINHVCP